MVRSIVAHHRVCLETVAHPATFRRHHTFHVAWTGRSPTHIQIMFTTNKPDHKHRHNVIFKNSRRQIEYFLKNITKCYEK